MITVVDVTDIRRQEWPGSGVPRSGGVHVTEVIRAIHGELYPGRYSDADGYWDLELAAEFGFTWERVLEKSMGERLGLRPKELKRDGITGSPDGVDEEEWRVDEIKFTWRSAGEDPNGPKWWLYRAQALAYAYMVGPNEAGDYPFIRWLVLYVNGDYRERRPVCKVFEAYPSEEDVKKNWTAILEYARGRGWIE